MLGHFLKLLVPAVRLLAQRGDILGFFLGPRGEVVGLPAAHQTVEIGAEVLLVRLLIVFR